MSAASLEIIIVMIYILNFISKSRRISLWYSRETDFWGMIDSIYILE